MHILLTNDDGIKAEGLWALSEELSKAANVIIVAPAEEQSGSSNSLTLRRPLRVDQIKPNAYAVDGRPTDAILLALHGLLEQPPDLIISGINNGPNLGEDVFYSGTVAAAFEGYVNGVNAIAISQINGAAEYFHDIARWMVAFIDTLKVVDFEDKFLLNINLPPYDRIKGIKLTKLGRRHYVDIIEKRVDPRGKEYFWIGGKPKVLDGSEGTDIWAIKNDYISITPLHSDMTDYKLLSQLEQCIKTQ